MRIYRGIAASALAFSCCLLVTADARADATIEANRMLSAMEGDAHHIATLLRSARAAHVAGPIQCVNGWLSQIDVSVRQGREDIATIRSATSTGDAAAAQRALQMLRGRREAARTASFAANACVTPVEAKPDQTVVHVIVDRRLAGPE